MQNLYLPKRFSRALLLAPVILWHFLLIPAYFASLHLLFSLICSLHACSVSCHIWLFVALWTITLQAPLFMGFSKQEYWSGLPCSPTGDLPKPGIEPASLMFPALADGFFTTSATWEVQYAIYIIIIYNFILTGRRKLSVSQLCVQDSV